MSMKMLKDNSRIIRDSKRRYFKRPIRCTSVKLSREESLKRKDGVRLIRMLSTDIQLRTTLKLRLIMACLSTSLIPEFLVFNLAIEFKLRRRDLMLAATKVQSLPAESTALLMTLSASSIRLPRLRASITPLP